MTAVTAPAGPIARADDGGPILLFDGVCNVCNAAVVFALRHERAPRLRFAALQSDAGRALIERHGLPGDVSTLVVLDGGRGYVRSAAAVRVLRALGGPWVAAAWLLWLVPWPLRDVGYRAFARLRYRLFGKRDQCMVPTPEIRARFL